MAKRIGFLGLGTMGGAMAANLVKAGFEVRGCDPSEEARRRARENGVETVSSPAEAASGAEVVCSSVPATGDVHEAYLGEKGALSAAAEGAVCFDFSTISVEGSREAAAAARARGVRFLDTPVSGSGMHARAATLAIRAGGDPAALAAHRDVLDAIGQSVHHFGENGAGLQMKLVTNLIFAAHLASLAEGLTLGKKAGLDPAEMVAFLKGSAIPRILEYKGTPLAERDYTPTFTVDLMRKDMGLIAGMGEAESVPLPFAALARQIYTGAARTASGRIASICSGVAGR